jgi:L-iditol 2-dehydrogenase
MKVAVVESPGKVALIEMPIPIPQRGDVLVRMRACGVCGTDVEKVYGEGLSGKILGHEAVGEVAVIGEGVEGASRGDRVFTHHHVPCYSCDVCSRGGETFCLEYRKHNLVPCGLAEYYILPRFNVERGGLTRLPNGLSFEDASFIEPLACCVRGLEVARARGARSALIYGAGPIGITHLKLLKSYGVPRIGMAEISEYRRNFAQQAGADVSFNPADRQQVDRALKDFPGGPELVIVAAGAVRAFEDAMRVVGQAGRVLQFGAPEKGARAEFDLAGFYLKGVDVVTSYAASEKDIATATKLLSDGSVVVSDMISHRFPFTKSAEAFEVAQQQQCMKAVITNGAS